MMAIIGANTKSTTPIVYYKNSTAPLDTNQMFPDFGYIVEGETAPFTVGIKEIFFKKSLSKKRKVSKRKQIIMDIPNKAGYKARKEYWK